MMKAQIRSQGFCSRRSTVAVRATNGAPPPPPPSGPEVVSALQINPKIEVLDVCPGCSVPSTPAQLTQPASQSLCFFMSATSVKVEYLNQHASNKRAAAACCREQKFFQCGVTDVGTFMSAILP